MARIKEFEELTSWQEARRLVNSIYEITRKDKFAADFELKSQIRRSAISVMANIAEGFHRNSDKDFSRFLDYARASLAETMSHNYIALDQDYIDQEELLAIKEICNSVGQKINKFISYLNQTSRTS
ncbi:MAG: four helix bundle protein [Pseudomonadota bacterium]